MTTTTQGSEYIREQAERFFPQIPHNADLGLKLIELSDARALIELPLDASLIGDTEQNLYHSSCLLSLLDAACGMAVFCALPELQRIATLDLRVDYLRAAPANQAIRCEAECYQLTERVAFVRASAWQDAARPIAQATATFMRTALKPRDRANKQGGSGHRAEDAGS